MLRVCVDYDKDSGPFSCLNPRLESSGLEEVVTGFLDAILSLFIINKGIKFPVIVEVELLYNEKD